MDRIGLTSGIGIDRTEAGLMARKRHSRLVL